MTPPWPPRRESGRSRTTRIGDHNPNALLDITEEPIGDESDDDDLDEFGGFLDNRGEDEAEAVKVTTRMTKEIGKEYEKELGKAAVEEDERLLDAFLSKNAGPQLTLADLIVARIKENDSSIVPSNANSDLPI